jgi:hypothetical protein
MPEPQPILEQPADDFDHDWNPFEGIDAEPVEFGGRLVEGGVAAALGPASRKEFERDATDLRDVEQAERDASKDAHSLRFY